MLKSNGSQWTTVSGEEYLRSGGGEKIFGVHFGDAASESVNFHGYRLLDGCPSFSTPSMA